MSFINLRHGLAKRGQGIIDSGSLASIGRRRSCGATPRRLGLEPLESRRLLSAAGLAGAGEFPPLVGKPVEHVDHAAVHQHAGIAHLPTQHRLIDTATGYLSSPAAGRPVDVAIAFLEEHASQLGIYPSDVASAYIADQYVSGHTGTTHLYLNQALNGLRIVNASLNINLAADGRVINVGSSFLPDVASLESSVAVTPSLAPQDALSAAAKHLGLGPVDSPVIESSPARLATSGTVLAQPELSLDEIPANLFYAPTADGGVTLAWNLVLRTPDGQHWYDVGVDAANGQMVYMTDWIDHASYNVYPIPIEAPNDGQRAVVVDPHDPVASPFGWHDTNGVAGADTLNTTGNNVFAQEDGDNNNSGGFRPNGGASLDFDFPLDLTQAPNTYQSSAITNLFYWNNLLHDVHYQYGFDEPSGNFQLNNYGNGGAGSDPVQADAQDGSGTDNANFGTPPDGTDPRMQMFIWTSTTPHRDSDFDNQIITHEYGHGVSNRLTGGPANSGALGALQSGGMGEGWSDWWGLMFTQKPTDTKTGSYGVGTYVLGQPTSGPGIRQFPYNFDMAVNPQSYARVIGNGSVHSIGEIWASALWDMNWLLIDKYGFDADLGAGYAGAGSAGNLLALQLVMDGLKLQPALPTLLDARDAIVAADVALTGGENEVEIWTAFARRGMGLSAFDGGDANSDEVVEAFDLPIFGLTVVSTDPALGSSIDTQPVEFTLDFSDPMVPNTVDAADLTINGVPAERFEFVDRDTVIFHFDVSPVTAEGPQVMEIAEGAMRRASDGEAGLFWQGVFFHDLLPLTVTATEPAANARLTARPTEIVLHFNEPVAADSLDNDDLTLDNGAVTAVELIDADSVRFIVDGLIGEGTVNYALSAGALSDVHRSPGLPHAGRFIIDDPFIERYRSLDVPQPITDNNLTTSSLTIDDVARILDLEVELDVTHTFTGDLLAALIAPDGTRVPLFTQVGSGGDDFTGTVLDDQAELSINEGRPPFTGRFRPQEPLAALNRMDARGTWLLEILDDAGGDVGTLDNWSLVVTRDPRLLVVASTPAGGTSTDIMPSDFTVSFSEPFDLATLDIADFSVNGVAPDRTSVDDDDAVTFHFDTSPVTAEGPQTMAIGEGVLTTLAEGRPNAAWQDVFFYDLQRLEVVATTPAEGATIERITEIVLDFNEPVQPETVGIDDLLPSIGSVVAAELVDADTVRYTIEDGGRNGTHAYQLPAGALADEHGSPNAAYVGSLIVDNPFLRRYDSTNVPLPIRDNQITTSELVIPDVLSIVDIDLELDITHTFDGDLEATLIGPDGTRISLFSFVGGGGNNFTDTVLDDEADTPINEGQPPFTGRFRPQEPLNGLDGTNVSGTWRLEIADRAGADEGSLNSWSLIIETSPRLVVEESSPADGQVINAPPVDFDVHFSEPLDPATIDAADLKVNGQPADRFTLTARDRVAFHYDASPVTVEGPQDMHITVGAIHSAADGALLASWNATFFYDTLALAVMRTTPSEGATLLAPQTEIEFFFNEHISTTSVDVADLVLSAGLVTSAEVVANNSLRFTVAGIENNGSYNYQLPAGAINDANGTPGPAYSGAFTIDNPRIFRVESQDVPLDIPSPGSVTSRIDVIQTIDIADLNVEINIAHGNVSDLSVTLAGPDGTRIQLFAAVGGSGDHFRRTVLDDEASVSIFDASPPFAGRFRPQQALSAFDGMPAEGSWQLSLIDSSAAITGRLIGWTLDITGAPTAGPPGDANGDGLVNIEDLNQVRNHFGATGHRVLGDTAPYDGVVDIADLNAVRNAIGNPSPLVSGRADRFSRIVSIIGVGLSRADARATRIPMLIPGATQMANRPAEPDPVAAADSRFRQFVQTRVVGQERRLARREARGPASLPESQRAWDLALDSLLRQDGERLISR